jgi:hypothetical protein
LALHSSACWTEEKTETEGEQDLKFEYVFLAVLGLAPLTFMVQSSVSLESGNTLLSGFMDLFFDAFKVVFDAILDFMSKLFGGSLS